MTSVAREGGNYGIANQGVFAEDGSGGFIRFGSETDLFNIYDACNFLTGKAYSLIGLTKQEILNGANLNSIITLHGSDSEADQRAISKGINFNGVRWRK
ncbi:hypothetical protein [Aquimarina algiphila]|uniref:Uncharacterized protein n=1 Tax=Aquimarina algiphila TaxID=2047982 RepID=A0A554VJW2_9FLAO|nr:hypothetical protein [Aquimarina algiphila]TSE08210.1 hypothetical protein FOF46_13480 [Aquimarina algiphila]